MLLALDTSTLTLSLALVERGGPDGAAVEEVRIGPPRKQSDVLPGAIDELLKRHGVSLASLEGLVVGLGPGSFTGLRIGLATAKALAYAARVRVAGASSLAAVALEAPRGRVLALAEARRGELYVGDYQRTSSGVEARAPEAAMYPDAFAELFRGTPEAVVLGPAVPAYRAELLKRGVPADHLSDAGAVPSALALARLATLPAAYDAQALFALEPHYVRASEAERNPKFPPLPGPEPAARIRGE